MLSSEFRGSAYGTVGILCNGVDGVRVRVPVYICGVCCVVDTFRFSFCWSDGYSRF